MLHSVSRRRGFAGTPKPVHRRSFARFTAELKKIPVQPTESRITRILLAGFAVGISNTAGLVLRCLSNRQNMRCRNNVRTGLTRVVRAIDLNVTGCTLRLHPAWLHTKLVDVHSGFFDLSRCQCPQVVSGLQTLRQARKYISCSLRPLGSRMYRFSDCPMSIHFCRRAAHSISHRGSSSKAVT